MSKRAITLSPGKSHLTTAQTGGDMEGDSKHDIHWLNSNPSDEGSFRPFMNAEATQYQGLFDKALEWSTGKVTSNEADIQKVIQKINSRVAGKITYNPGIKSYDQNPLGILNGENGGEAVCGDNALVLRGLLRSIGLDGVQEKYHWGGDEATSKRNYYCPPSGCTTPTTTKPVGNRITMQAKRDQLGCSGFPECIEKNPSFTYHATVVYEGNSFDPSYGIVEGTVELLTAINVPAVGEPECVHGADATALRVTRNALGITTLAANNNTNKTCSPRLSSISSGARLFRFDALGGADVAVVRWPLGQWIVRNEFGEETDLQAIAYDPLHDALAPADYDGDGLTDPAVWFGTGEFFFRMSSNYYKVSPSFWRPKSFDEKAVPGNYDGDGISDIASWRSSDGMWTIRRSSGGPDIQVEWGAGSLGDIPVPGDYDGDGKTDVAIWRSSTGDWWVLRSSDGSSVVMTFGTAGDIPVQGDYDGDGKTDYVVARPSTGVWYFLESESGYQFRAYPGPTFSSKDIPVPADYNSDSKTDVAVWFGSTGTWHIVDSQTGQIRLDVLGLNAGAPVMAASVFRQ